MQPFLKPALVLLNRILKRLFNMSSLPAMLFSFYQARTSSVVGTFALSYQNMEFLTISSTYKLSVKRFFKILTKTVLYTVRVL